THVSGGMSRCRGPWILYSRRWCPMSGSRKSRIFVDAEALAGKVHHFLRDHYTEVAHIADSLPHIFEAVCFVTFVRHYEPEYEMKPANLMPDGKFRFRWS